MAFKDKAWSARFAAMGDEAEGVFEQVLTDAHVGFARYGLNRPPLRMGMIPARIRYTPDYLMSAKLVEVQGVGQDGIVKLKLDKWGALHWWNDVHPVELFIWDSHHQRYGFIQLLHLDEMVADGHVSLDRFPEGKTYFAFSVADIWEHVYDGGEF